MAGRDHAGARKLGAERQCVAVETHQIVDEQEQPAHPGGELPRGQHEVADIGDGLRAGAHALGALLVAPPRQRREAFLGENLSHRGGAQRRSLLLERLTDLVDRVVALAQRHDLLMGPALLGLIALAGASGREEVRQLTVAEVVAQHAERARRVAEAARHLGRRRRCQEVGPQGLILALARGRRFARRSAGILLGSMVRR